MKCQDDILARVGELSPLPGTVVRLIDVINDPGSTAQDIVAVVKYDQAATVQMLRMCNSAHFGLSRTVSSLDEAICYLGTVKVLQLLMAVHGNALLAKRQRGYGLEPGMLWKHSVAVALAASALSQSVNLANGSLAFTAGLLHDIGKVVLNEYVAEEFSEIARIVTERDISFSEAERLILGYSHEDIGGKVAEKWKLPAALVRCIRYHHDPSLLEPADPLVDMVYVADCVCLLVGIGLGKDELYYRADPAVMERNDLHETDLESAGATMMNELKRVEEMFASTPTPSRDR
jgi:putative nucleotidyltransferase with HDIG domain